MTNQKKNLDLIQLLRGVAAMLVVLLHSTNNAVDKLHVSFLNNFFLFGGSGVDIFFVLSGFIITYTNSGLLTNTNNVRLFARRRIVRIYPTYWVIITFFLLIHFLLPAFYSSSAGFTPTNLLGTYLLLPDHIMVNGVSWTLSYELFFYFLFAVAFFIRNKKLLFILSAIYCLNIILLPILIHSFENSNPWLNLVTYPMNLEFFMGITAAVLIKKIPAKAGVPMVIAGSLAFIASGVLSVNGYNITHDSFNRVILFGIPSFFIVTGLVVYELYHKINVRRIFVLIGEASYSLYLIHLPIIAAALKIFSKFNISNIVLIHIFILTLIVIICFLSILFYRLFEKPVIKILNSKKRVNVAERQMV